jgi:hypothetical protein
MWTDEHRRIYRCEGSGYPSDLRDAEWARLAPLIPEVGRVVLLTQLGGDILIV